MAISPFILRRLKTDKHVITDLPEKMVINDYCYLSKSQAVLYEKTLNEMMEKISGFTGINRRGNIFKLITALKQICNHPYQFLKGGEMSKELSGKMDKCISTVQNILENNEKTLIFTQYKEMGDILTRIIAEECNENPLFFHGSLTIGQREKLIEEFKLCNRLFITGTPKNHIFIREHDLYVEECLEIIHKLELCDYYSNTRSYNRRFLGNDLIIFEPSNVVLSNVKNLGNIL